MTASRAFADVLRWVPLFADLDPELRAEVAGRAAPVRVEAGQWLFREGEPADSLYVVLMTALDQLARLREAGGAAHAPPWNRSRRSRSGKLGSWPRSRSCLTAT